MSPRAPGAPSRPQRARRADLRRHPREECADPASPLFTMPEQSLASEFPNPDVARRVLEAVGGDVRAFTTLAGAAGGRGRAVEPLVRASLEQATITPRAWLCGRPRAAIGGRPPITRPLRCPAALAHRPPTSSRGTPTVMGLWRRPAPTATAAARKQPHAPAGPAGTHGCDDCPEAAVGAGRC
jgi:hypothetical protein